MVDADCAGNELRGAAARPIFDFRRQIHDLVQPVAGDRRALKQIDDKTGHPERLYHHVYEHEKGHEVTHGHRAVEHLVAHRCQARHPGGHGRVDAGLLVECVCVGLVGCGEAADLVVLLHHRLDRAYAGQVFLHVGTQVRQTVLDVLGGDAHFSR